VHHSTYRVPTRRVRGEILSLSVFRGYAQLGGTSSKQARRALGACRTRMDAIDRDPVPAQLNRQRLRHVHQAGIACSAAEIARIAGVGPADVDDASPSCLLHQRNDGTATA